ncbi:hypothetical protein SEA_MARSHAWN_35 [Mycobacterium phage Marshawn]|uniref:Minor tail protein n=1 Tax=Mycobacterium phage Marshawn TaxID=2652423 RepID=A0A5P8D828_9CAUD|nr:hypothetical protein I5H02_gp64 [Mycobacterium phage Marshawn]QFP94821.1 hypothetical protein SEA_MARSHAWN_35 [Mycobacterium phage Marshawn]
MAEGTGLLAHLPQQWVGIGATLLFAMYISGQLIEKFEGLAKVLPFGKWYHERQARRRNSSRVGRVAEDNEVIAELREQIAGVVLSSRDQHLVVTELNDTLRCSRAYSAYEARWHHRHDVQNAGIPEHRSDEHLDYFDFEKLWRQDPHAAATL